MKNFILPAVLTASVILTPTTSHAASNDQVKAFLQSVGCSRLPTGVCDALSAENAKNILRVYQSRLSEKFCGTSNFSQARQFLEMDLAHDADKCRKLLAVVN